MKLLDQELKKQNKKIPFASAFLTHGLPTIFVKGWKNKFQETIQTHSSINQWYPDILTVQVRGTKGPIRKKALKKAIKYNREFIKWISNS